MTVKLHIPEAAASQIERDLQHLHEFWHNTPDMLFILLEGGCIEKVSDSVAKYVGYTPMDLEGRNYTDFIHPDDMAKTKEESDSMKLEQRGTSRFTNRYKTKDGTYVWLIWYTTPWQGGRLYCYVRYGGTV